MNFEHNDVPMRFTCALPVQSEARFQKKNGRNASFHALTAEFRNT